MKDAILWKRVLNEGVAFGGGMELPDIPREMVENGIITAPIILAPVTKSWDQPIVWEDYKHLSFPFPTFWMEGPDSFVENGVTKTANWGALVFVTKIESGWQITLLTVLSTAGRPPMLVGSITALCDGEGNYVADQKPRSMWADFLAEHQGIQQNCTMLAQVLDNLVLLGCKNVSLAPRDNSPKEVWRAIKRHGGGADDYRYHVLVVRPAGAKFDSPAQEIGIMPLHVCRGHFAEYGPEFNKGLLFGKYSGRFFIPPHMKGKKENGIVEKDYAIPA